METIFEQLNQLPEILVKKIKKEWSIKLKDLKTMISEEKYKECTENAYNTWLSQADGRRDMYNKYKNWYDDHYEDSDYIYDEKSNVLYCTYFILNIGRGGYNNQTISYNNLRKECKLCKDNKIELIFDYRQTYPWNNDSRSVRKKIFLIETDDNMDKLLSFKCIE